MSLVELTQIIAAFAFVGGAIYWGGQVKHAVDTLCKGQTDHEGRLRNLEQHQVVPATAGHE